MSGFNEYCEIRLAELADRGQLRTMRPLEILPGCKASSGGRHYLNFSGNDYLGVAGDEELRAQFAAMTQGHSPGFGSTGSRLLGGTGYEVTALESALAERYRRSALVVNSGYHANVGILPALTNRDSIVFADKLCHASIIDGLRLCECTFKRYRHLDMAALEAMLEAAHKEGRRSFIVTESLFSMDGDFADLAKLVDLKKRYDAVLVVDEAHAVGALGPGGLGLVAQAGVLEEVDVMIGTFGKAFGSCGAYIISNPTVREVLVNFMRPLIFSTALPPMVSLWNGFVLNRMEYFEPRRARLGRLSAAVREVITAAGYNSCGSSHIVPLLVGGNEETMALAEKLRAAGMLVGAVRPPTVPPGGARLRFSMSSAFGDDVAERIGEALK